MARRKTLSDLGVAALKPRAARYAEPDPEMRGHYVRVQPGGAKSFVVVARNPAGKQVWATIGGADVLRIGEARGKARTAIQRIRAGLPAVEQAGETFEAVVANYLKRHVIANGLRSRGELERILGKYILPAWGRREFASIRRSDVAALLDKVQDENGATQADAVLAVIRGAMNWHAARADAYTPPLARGMRRSDPKTRARARILDDNELRAVWRAAETNGTFGAFIRLAMLTAQRKAKLVKMRWEDIDIGGEWHIPADDREKGTAGSLVLPEVALAIIQAQPRLTSNSFVFAGRGGTAFNAFSQSKRRFDQKLAGVAPWTIHDLRRTARSLMSRAGVRPDIAERVLGHAIAGVEGVYDRHSYREEKADALARLAGLIGAVVEHQSATFFRLRQRNRCG